MPKQAESIWRYPLYFESLSVVIVVTLVAYLLAGTVVFVSVMSEDSPIVYVAWPAAFMLVVFFSEYGLEIIDSSVQGMAKPPALSFFMVDSGRFLRQMFMMVFFAGLALGAFSRGMDYLGVLVLCFLCLVFPASLAVNVMYENTLEVINPLSLLGFMMVTGRDYLFATSSFAALFLAFTIFITASLGTFLLFLPFGLYGLLLFCRQLGLACHKRRTTLWPERDYNHAEKQIQQYYETHEKLHEILKNAYDRMHEDKIDEAIQLIKPIIELGDWARFDAVFEITSQWPDKTAALSFVKPYLPVVMHRKNSMRVLQLCEWALTADADFCLEDEAMLEQLVRDCVSREQFVTAVRLLENFALQNLSQKSARQYLMQAADICQARLHNQRKFDELQHKLVELAGESKS